MLACFFVLCGLVTAAGKCSGTTTAADEVEGRDMTGQLLFITGGDSGIGFEAAKAAASINATVVIASVFPTTTGADARAAIVNATGNTKVEVISLDLSNFSNIRAAAGTFLAAHQSLDTLVNDAGIDHCPTGLAPMTADGYEQPENMSGCTRLLAPCQCRHAQAVFAPGPRSGRAPWRASTMLP